VTRERREGGGKGAARKILRRGREVTKHGAGCGGRRSVGVRSVSGVTRNWNSIGATVNWTRLKRRSSRRTRVTSYSIVNNEGETLTR